MIVTSESEDFSRFREIAVDPFYLKDPNLIELFKKSLPPREAYLYFPKGEEIVIFNKKKPEKTLRRIHINVPFTDQENIWLSEFHQMINDHPENVFPDYWNDGLNLSYIYSTECNIEKAYKRLIDYFKWYNQHFPMNIQPEDKSIKLLNTGFTYIYGRDHQFRPIIICQPYILQKYEKEYSETDVVNASIFICQYMVNYMLIPGQIENWIMFINLGKTSLLRMPDPIKKLIKALSDYFIARLYKSYIIGMNAILRLIFKFMCSFLEEVTAKKFVILEGKKDPKLFTDINPQNLEERFGGQAPDCVYDEEFCLFPPRMPSNNYFFHNEEPEKILITEDEYIERYNKGQIPPQSVSPFIMERINRERIQREKEEMTKRKQEEALLRIKDAKTKAELNINTTWTCGNELFDLDKFQTSSPGFLEGLNSFRSMKDKFCSNIVTLNVQVSSDNDNFE